MASESANASAQRERLSALVDGELEGEQVATACTAWRDEHVRSTWHAYHLIGDVLRSEDLASHAARDGAFLASLRERLAEEPVVLAPAPAVAVSAVRVRRRGWMAPAAAVAGFAAVAGVVTVMRATEPVAVVAQKPAVTASPVAASAAQADRETAITGPMIRDVGLDLYLSAHKEFVGSSALGVPQGFLRSATANGSGR